MHEEFKPGDILMSEQYDGAQWVVDKECPGDWSDVVATLTHNPDDYNGSPRPIPADEQKSRGWNILSMGLVKVDSLDDQSTRTNQRVMQETHDYYSLLTELTMGE